MTIPLTYLDCTNNNLTSLDVSNNTALTYLNCCNNNLTSFDVSNNTALTGIKCDNNNLTSLDVSNNTALTIISCYNNKLTSLDVSNNTALKYLNCCNNNLTSLDLSNNTELMSEYLDYSNNTYEISLENGTFDLLTMPEGFNLDNVSNWTNATVNGSIITVTDLSKSVTYEYNLGNDKTATFTLNPAIEINEENFPDKIFRDYVKEKFDTDGNGILSAEEINTIINTISIDVSDRGISDLKGIEYFTSLKYLNCCNNNLTSLDVSNNTALETLYCYNNNLTSLDVRNNPLLDTLYCDSSVHIIREDSDIETTTTGDTTTTTTETTTTTVTTSKEDSTSTTTTTVITDEEGSTITTITTIITEEDTSSTTTEITTLPQTGYSEIYRIIVMIASLMILSGAFAVVFSRKKDSE